MEQAAIFSSSHCFQTVCGFAAAVRDRECAASMPRNYQCFAGFRRICTAKKVIWTIGRGEGVDDHRICRNPP
ncbi:hypothetical protein RRSWK_00961 [Rhodopirellula sp. SWK7]|nr:hypothetical protein RRSWK_00961 [Rhodopirellula sp. SWK7]